MVPQHRITRDEKTSLGEVKGVPNSELLDGSIKEESPILVLLYVIESGKELLEGKGSFRRR